MSFVENEFKNEDEINFKEILFVLWNSKIFIAICIFCFAVGSVYYSLSIPNKFTSISLLKANDGAISSGQSSSGLDVLGSLAGVNLSGTGSTKSSLAIATLESRDFLRHILKISDTLPYLTAVEEYNKQSKKIEFNSAIYDEENKTWKDPLKKPSFEKAYKAYRKILDINITKSGFVELSITHHSPQFAKDFLVLVINELNSLSRTRDLLESKASLEYLNRQLLETKQTDIRFSINELVKSELRRQMLANVQLEYLLKPLDSAFIPELKSSPNRPQICINGTLLGFLLGILVSLIRHYGFRRNQT
tara:strand:- start:10 stop:924 length:915 start_codon:yes stop_codon:yes gene_type:complete